MKKLWSQTKIFSFLLVFTMIVVGGCSGGEGSSFEVYSDLESSVHDKVNNYRVSQGKTSLEYDNRIAEIAREHSRNMAKNGKVNHEGFNNRVAQVNQALGTSNLAMAENAAFNSGYSDPVQVAIDGWINSQEGHKENMLNDNNFLTGVGIAVKEGKYYFTQIFVRK